MTVSVILSTYNQPEWLEKVLWGYSAQSWRDFEVIVADDGSRDETTDRIESLRASCGLDLHHVWHPDRGFRKSTILNRAIEAARGGYLIFSDGDCIPRRDFVEAHVRHARPGRFLSGGYVKLPAELSRRITREDVATGRVFEPRWLRAEGLDGGRFLLKLWARGWRAPLLNALTTTRATWNGHNASGWKSDLVAANGFDERMGYGGQDRELGERLENAGVRGRQIRFSAVCVHLDHGRGYVDREAWERNREIRRETRRSGRTRTEYGIEGGEGGRTS